MYSPLVTRSSATQKCYIPEGYKYPEMKQEKEDGAISNDYLALLNKISKRCNEMGVNLILCISP